MPHVKLPVVTGGLPARVQEFLEAISLPKETRSLLPPEAKNDYRALWAQGGEFYMASVRKRGKSWSARWLQSDKTYLEKGGFPTKKLSQEFASGHTGMASEIEERRKILW